MAYNIQDSTERRIGKSAKTVINDINKKYETTKWRGRDLRNLEEGQNVSGALMLGGILSIALWGGLVLGIGPRDAFTLSVVFGVTGGATMCALIPFVVYSVKKKNYLEKVLSGPEEEALYKEAKATIEHWR